MARDYYDVLGVKKTASEDELKQAYRRLARKYHPDRTEEADGEEKFKEMKEAYDVLSDPQKRAAYDQFGKNWDMGGSGFRGGNSTSSGDMTMEELIRRMREQGFDTSNFEQRVTTQKVTIPVDTMINGGQATFRYMMPGASSMGFSFTHSFATVDVEPNTKVGQRFVLPDVKNCEFVFVPASTMRCRVQGLDIIVPFEVNALATAVGNKSAVRHPNGKRYDVVVPAGTKNGAGLRLPKLGLPHVNGAVGSLIALVDYHVPTLTDKQKDALKKLLEEA